MLEGGTDELTRSTRVAANAAVLAVVMFSVLWVATTQVSWIRDASPFADDPWDAVASYAAIFLPLVAGATWIRSLSHRGVVLPPVTAARIRRGAGLAIGIVLASVGGDVLAIATSKPAWAPGDVRLTLILLLLGLAGLAGAVAGAFLVRAAIVARSDRQARTALVAASLEPDIVDDLLALAADVARPIGLGRPVGRLSAAIERFLDHSAISPRRHRTGFGVVLASAAAVGFVAWHAVVEGGWGSPVAMVLFGALVAAGVLGIYLGTVGSLRLLRPAGTARPRSGSYL
jgi:hypothetical protein